jgi:polyvinyl alcohol dehydrogenase (cytochrome)
MSQVGPGGHLGGIHWGTAADEHGIYVGVNDEKGAPYKMGGMGPQAGMQTSVGSWAALDPAGAQHPAADGGYSKGKILWQIANPSQTAVLNGASVNAPLTVSNGVIFAGSMDAMGTMYALDANTGDVLWQYQSGATVYGGPAISNGVVYWGSGYPSNRLGMGTHGTYQLYAFDIEN